MEFRIITECMVYSFGASTDGGSKQWQLRKIQPGASPAGKTVVAQPPAVAVREVGLVADRNPGRKRAGVRTGAEDDQSAQGHCGPPHWPCRLRSHGALRKGTTQAV